MTVEQLQTRIGELVRGEGDVRGREGRAIDRVIAMLDAGDLRAAEPRNAEWVTNAWVKEAILLYFMRHDSKIPIKDNHRKRGVRCVKPGVARHGSFLAPGVVLMPDFVNIGAYVGEGTMIDTWATVGSCAQVGRNCHISGGAGIGGVLEPLQANPVIVEDNCFIGARSEVAEGAVVREGAVLAIGVFIGGSAKVVDRNGGEIYLGEVPAYAVVVPGSLPGEQRGGRASPHLACAVIVKRVDEKTRAKTSINELLRD